MDLHTRCFPPSALPYENIDVTTRMIAKLYPESPFLAVLPKIAVDDNILMRTLANVPGIKIKDGQIVLKTSGSSYQSALQKLDKAFNSQEVAKLEEYGIESVFLEKYLQIIKKFKSPHAYINLLGPFTISQVLINSTKEQVINDKTFRKLFIQSVCVKAQWMINKIKEYSPTTVPIVILEESALGQLGMIKRENEDITMELVTTMLERVIEKIKSMGAICAVQCMEKCDWQVPIDAGADIISFDAYNNPNNLCIIPDKIKEFIERGGKINWAILPGTSESVVKGLNLDHVAKRLYATFDGLILAGVPVGYVYNSALVSVQGTLDHLPLIFAEKAVMLTTQLGKRIPVKS